MDDPSSAAPAWAPLILTAQFDARSAALFEDLRGRHFPARLNRVPAHATLFHHLPGAERRAVSARIATACSGTGPLPFTIVATRDLGRGVAFALDCPGLVALRASLAAAWRDWLTPQDRQGYRPHLTVQNKVPAEVARATRETLDQELPILGAVEGLDLWHYRGGPWEAAERFPFQDR